jgi:hypothetical protein
VHTHHERSTAKGFVLVQHTPDIDGLLGRGHDNKEPPQVPDGEIVHNVPTLWVLGCYWTALVVCAEIGGEEIKCYLPSDCDVV